MTLFGIDAIQTTNVAERSFAAVPSVTALERDFPAAALSLIGERESWRKEVHRPATSTHKWWAKRLGSVFRGILISAVTVNRTDAVAAYESASRLEGLVVFDPFGGSGVTAFEPAKIGAECVLFAYNP